MSKPVMSINIGLQPIKYIGIGRIHQIVPQIILSVYYTEVIGAVASVFIIWIITGVLVYEAVKRLIHNDEVIDADIMLITACVGVFFNVL